MATVSQNPIKAKATAGICQTILVALFSHRTERAAKNRTTSPNAQIPAKMKETIEMTCKIVCSMVPPVYLTPQFRSGMPDVMESDVLKLLVVALPLALCLPQDSLVAIYAGAERAQFVLSEAD